MATLFGILGLPETDRSFIERIGQSIIYDACQRVFEEFNQDLALATSAFVAGQTPDFKFRYKLPGTGRMQRRGGRAQSGTVRAGGEWDVALPLEDFGNALGGDDVAMAYMTLPELERHLQTIQNQATGTYRYEMLRALYNNTARTFVDNIRAGTLTIVPLANGDSVSYPPVHGSETEATDNHYLVAGYTAISDANNPFPAIREELEEHFGAAQGGSDIIVFINQAQTPEVENLADFDPVNDRYIVPGANTDIPTKLPLAPGRILGRINGVWVAEWRWVPAGYLHGMHLGEEAPLMERVDPAETGLGTGLQLISSSQDAPLSYAQYRFRFGLGVTNRLNGVVMQLKASGTYDVPAIYQ
ncbi:MAG TPA: hypothetical protein VFS21_29830 [Roseiflexaceae bacterium]|nr:hypothetical protein [Roseiflexaceae bacterium]